MTDLPVMLVFAPQPVELQSPPSTADETRQLDCRWYDSDADLGAILVRERPDLIVSFGDRRAYPRLHAAPYQVRRRWLHFDVDRPSDAERERCGALAFCYFLRRVLAPDTDRLEQAPPLVSVFTPVFRPGERIHRAYRSLAGQSFDNWEWVVVDDSDDDGATGQLLNALALADPRIAVHTSHHSGRIGETKRRACALSRGEILVELDHDDELTPDALADIVAAFQSHPEAGFAHSDWVEIDERTGHSLTYAPGWAFGFGRYRTEQYRGRSVQVAVAPPVNATTIRHIVSAPNHVRAWRRDAYWRIGGHNPALHVADDYELLVRTFLHTPVVHIPKLCYVQYLNSGRNAQDLRRREIQRLVRVVSDHYGRRIDERARQLGLLASPKVIVSFTTLPSRIDRIGPMIDSIRAQTRAPDELRLYLPAASAREHATYVPPDWLAASGVRVVRSERDWGPATKLLPCLIDGGHPEDVLITVDDDVVYERHLVEDLIEASRTYQDSVVCMMGVDEAGGFIHAGQATIATEVAVVGGYRGVLYRRRFFDAAALEREHAATASGDVHLADDHLFSEHLTNRGVRLLVAASARSFRLLDLGNGIFAPERAAAAKAAAEAVVAYFRQRCRALSVIVLDAAASALTARCLRSVRRFCPGAEIVLVGNGVDSPARDLADVYVATGGNIGVAAGWNLAATRATRPYLCFLNDDAAFVDEETPTRLLAAAAGGAVAGPYSNRAKPPQGDVSREDTPAADRPIDAVVGVCLIVAREIFDRIGGFDPRFLTWDDDDFCVRAGAAGAPSVVAGGAWIDHEGHATFKALGLDIDAVMRQARRRFDVKHASVRVTAIAHDEESAIEGYFGQFEGLTRDLVLLDTGSTDRTRELAERAGARVNTAPGVEMTGFATARNTAAGRGSIWIVMLDPDERLDRHTIAAIPELIASAGSRFDAFLAPLEAVGRDGSRRRFVAKPFLYRSEACRWRYLVHEKLVGGRHALVTNACIEHRIGLHSEARRDQAWAMYRRMSERERYFTDAAYRAGELEAWPILDEERGDDPRIQKIQAGPLVSVVIPTFDRPELCVRAVRSALAQNWVTLEVIVVGDACPRFAAVMAAFEDDPRVRGINLPGNHGPGGAIPRNLGILAAAGEWIAYLDDDNTWDADHVSSVIAAIRATGASWGFSSMRIADGTDLGFWEPARGRIDTSCVVHAKRLIDAHGPWLSLQETDDYAHDWELFSRWVANGEPWAATRKPTLLYNIDTSRQAAFLQDLAGRRRSAARQDPT
jgi:GT2 family glycosyltransferase